MHLPAGLEMHTGKLTENGELQRRHENLRQMHVDNLGATNTANLAPVDNRELELRGNKAIDTAFGRSRVN